MTLTRRFLRARQRAFLAIAAAIAIVAVMVAGPVCAEGAGAPGWNLDRLMSTLARNKSGRATFVETKYLSIAAQPVESSGELVFVVDGDKLTIERNQRKMTLPLGQYPELSAFIDSIRATLAGNRFALEQVYKVAITGRGEDWTLTLTPLDARMLKAVSTITLDGTRDRLRSVAIQQADGDHSVMRLKDTAPN
jgi:hypothetical protein